MKVWIYESRCDSPRVFVGNHVGWILARTAQDEDNRCSLEDVKESGSDFGGSEDEGHFYIDDGGSIRLVEIEGLEQDVLHLVEFSDSSFTIQHPLAERLEGQLWDCELHEYISSLSRRPVGNDGIYTAEFVNHEWKFSRK